MRRTLSTQQYNQQMSYLQNGFIILRGVLDYNDIEKLKKFVYEQKDIQLASGNTKAKIYGLYDRDPNLMNRLISNEKLVNTLTNLLGPNVIFVKNRHNQAAINSKVDTAVESRFHRDILQLTRGLLTTAIYLEDSNIENGATMVIPGSHNLPTVGVPQIDGGGTWLDEHDEYAGISDQAIPVTLKAGDALLFNGMLFHSVGSNITEKTRASIILGFRSVDELDASGDAKRQIVVAGEDIYRGND